MGGLIAKRSRWEIGLIAARRIEAAARPGMLQSRIQMSSVDVRFGKVSLDGVLSTW